MKYVRTDGHTTDRQMEGQTHGRETIIPRHYRVAGYKNMNIFDSFYLSFFGSIVYNRATLYKCQNCLKVVVHVIIID